MTMASQRWWKPAAAGHAWPVLLTSPSPRRSMMAARGLPQRRQSRTAGLRPACGRDGRDPKTALRRFGFFGFGVDRAGILALGVGVAVDQFDDRHRRVVAVTVPGLDDAGIAALP